MKLEEILVLIAYVTIILGFAYPVSMIHFD
jgi:hypothetical protein